MQTLSMRDAMTARHSAAVARYAREVARMLGVDEREQDLIHTAALLHDIGKFIFPDSILLADRKLTDDESGDRQAPPGGGRELVRRIEGYGPVADIIISHHERVDGKGYPHGVPAGTRSRSARASSRSRIRVRRHDVRDSYRRPVSCEAAIVKLRRVAGSQLDPEVVEVFVEMVESGRGGVPPRGRSRLRARAGVRAAGRRLRPPASCGRLDARSIQPTGIPVAV